MAQEWVDADSGDAPDPGEVVSYLAGPRGVECRGYYDQQNEEYVFSWYLYDGLGSVLAEVDEGGNVTHATAKYDVYGAVDSADQYGTTDSKHGFVGSLGHQVEPATGGLIYMRARWYDPATGRFVSEDPAGDGTNWYAYCENNPTSYMDSTGKSCEPKDWAEFLWEVDCNILASVGDLMKAAGAAMMAAGALQLKKGAREWIVGKLTQIGSGAGVHPYFVLLGEWAGKVLEAKGGNAVKQGMFRIAEGAILFYLGNFASTAGEDAKEFLP